MLNPQAHETLIDTAAGSCGFPVHAIFHVWKQLEPNKSNLFTLEEKSAEQMDYVREKVFAIDFDEKVVRVGRTLNLIAGDGQTNVLHLNTLDWKRWNERIDDEDWTEIYFEGWKKLKKLRAEKDSNRDFQFDILMANPPFAGDIKESTILSLYELAKDSNENTKSKVGRDILFIERNLDFLKDGGRMAIVLPQGRFNNSTDKDIRNYIAERCRILAVVGLHGNVFKPHTGTKTSVLFVQKWDDELCPRVEDYPIFFATMQEPSKDNSGEKIYLKEKDLIDEWKGFFGDDETEDVSGAIVTEGDEPFESAEPIDIYDEPKDTAEYVLDDHDHLVVKHDLFSHPLKNGLRTPEGIAEAFQEFAKKENLSFF